MMHSLNNSIKHLLIAMIFLCPSAVYAEDSFSVPNYTEAESQLCYCQEVSELVTDTVSQSDDNPSSRLLVGTVSEYDFSRFDGITDIIFDGTDRYVLQFENSESAKAALKVLQSNPDIRYVERDSVIYAEATDGDACSSRRSWGIDALNLSKYSEYVKRNKPAAVTVAVLDTGCADEHELFSGKLVDGYNIIGDNYYTEDKGGHGTHVAGIIADCTYDIAGIKIMPVSVMYSSGFGYASLAAAGVDYAVAEKADIINMSFSYAHDSSYLEDSIDNALSRGCVCVAAAGNQGGDVSERCPAHINDIITVGAVNEDYSIADYSNRGDAIDVVAPGTDICSAWLDGSYAEKSGTSMSAPHISACLALIKSVNPKLSPAQLEQLLLDSCTDLGAVGRDTDYGYGLPDMSKLIPDEDRTSPIPQTVISPRGTSIRKLTSSKGAIRVTWKKQSAILKGKRIIGYQLQLSRKSDFSSIQKKLTIKGYKNTTRKISGLRRRTKYYCRVRTYIKISGKTRYSKWSAVKSRKTR